ncbi:MAG TPA: protein-L-isoaspartate(D-aspartate) O-methyltransferase [bacterium]|nr:protein-L-isoaspartate(D-aspartate) O-methyltransferase [bacterium]
MDAREISRLAERHVMVRDQLEKRGIHNPWVLQAMLDVPRHFFLSETQQTKAYDDGPLPIGGGQTISQPYIVASMIELIEPDPSHRVLEVGVGSGYSIAVLRRIVKEVYGVEKDPRLLEQAQARLKQLNLGEVQMRAGDGSLGWPEAAPFDSILVAAAAPKVPASLVAQLKPGGNLVVPVGGREEQDLIRVHKNAAGHIQEKVLYKVRFVPLVGAEGWSE